ncbi:hypothetical protein PRAG_00141 [Prochlorococcus phage P-SSM3]|uniref:Uncharacterized protein n=1 Tax=Prochlorococcus phage P-SSM3 TaxID=536453 RepID=R9S725_9CAUD|nr:hypothetical protein PRAG_00141 [Prochlorococcus phage P-SSM3]AGN12080.1 hypothetical protein PRAG_00141 [Prochlorococcus phage P-SSM3]
MMEAFKAPNFLKGLLQMLGALFKMFVGIPILKWFADPRNREKIKLTLMALWAVFKGISAFIKSTFVAGINSLAKAMRGDGMSTWQRIIFFAKGILAFGTLIIGLKWLNPLRIGKTIKEIGAIFKGFNVALFNFRNALRAKKGLKALKYKKGLAGSSFMRRAPGFGKGALVVGGLVTAGSLFMGGDAEAAEEGEEEEVPERREGGPVGKQYQTGRTIGKNGGMIRGPETGYPVSLDGGKTTSFIGHGTEKVVSDKKGGGYVIPINNAATRANPYLTAYNEAAAAGMGMAPELFIGGLFKGAGNLLKGRTWGGAQRMGTQANFGTGRDGGFGTGTHGSGWPSAWDGKPVGGQTNSPTKKPGLWGQIGNFLTKGDGQTSGAAMIGRMFGNEQAGASIGNIMGIFQGGGSGKDGKATGWDIIKGIGGVAGNFLGGSKAGGWINTAMGIGDILKGDGNWASKFRDIAGNFGGTIADLIGGKTGSAIGSFMNSYFNGTAGGIGDLISGMGAQAGTGRIADAANHPGYSGGMGVTDPEGGIPAAKILGRQMLSRGMTVYGHPNFKNNKFNKENKANEKGYDPGGRQPVGGGPFHSKGLGLNIADYRPGDFGARLRNLADFLRGQIDTFKVVQIIYDKWGMWFAGQKEKKGPSKYGYPDSIGVGVAPKTEESMTGVGSQQAVANSQRTIMKNALEGGDGSVGDAALNIRKVFNQATAMDAGAKKSDFGGNFFMDLLKKGENNKISDAFMKSSDQKKGLDAFALAQDNEGLTNFLYKKGANEEQATNYLNLIDGDLFSKTPSFNNDDKFSFSTNFKVGNSLFTKDDGKSATDFYAKKNMGVTDSEISSKQKNQNISNNRGTAFSTSKKDGESLISKAPKTQSSVSQAGGGGQNTTAQDKARDYYSNKAAKERTHATSAMNDKIQQTIQTALATVQAHNSSVQALVQSENQKVLQMQKNAQSMAAKVQQQMKQRQQNQNQSAVA